MTLAGSAQETATIDGITYLLDGGKASVMQQKGLTGDIVIPETVRYGGDDYTVTTVQNNAFSGNDITGVVLPNTVTVMGSSCFSSCSKLVSADLPDNITSLGGNSFSFCYSLKSVDLPEALVSLGDMCFESCNMLEAIELPAGVTSLGSACFSGCTALQAITLPNSIDNIESRCFESCSALESIVVPSGVTRLYEECFSYCSKLASVALPESIEKLYEYCFSNCTSLSGITLPAGLKNIGAGCFRNCSGLTSILLPRSVETLGSGSFSDCTYLADVTCQWDDPDEVSTSNFVFGDIYTECRLHVPTGTTALYKVKEPWSGFKFIIEEDGQVVDPVRCATPTIAYADNSLTFGCATEGAEYHYTISASDAVEGAYSADGKVALGAAYDITVYASAHGYLNSEEAKAVLCFIDATLNTAGINLDERRGVVVSSHDGSITVSGLADGEQVALYSVGGMMLSAGKASAGSITLSAGRTDGVVLVKIADRSIKISVNRL